MVGFSKDKRVEADILNNAFKGNDFKGFMEDKMDQVEAKIAKNEAKQAEREAKKAAAAAAAAAKEEQEAEKPKDQEL